MIGRSAAASAAVAAALLAAGCGGGPQLVSGEPAPAGASTPSASATTGADGGFAPASVTATTEAQFWVLGSKDCGSPGACPARLVRTTDGGQRFADLAAPGGATVAGDQPSDSTVTDVRFAADRRNGWAFGYGLWATHDGGRSWHPVSQVSFSVLSLEVASGTVWAVVGSGCSAGTCTSYHLDSSPAGVDGWTSRQTLSSGPAPSLALDGRTVSVLDGTALRVSVDAEPFTSSATPCSDGGQLQTTGEAVWVVCDGSSVYRADAAGKQFSSVGQPAGSGTRIGAHGSGLAVAAGADGFFRTDDSGKSWTRVHAPAGTVRFVGLSNATVGYVVTSTGLYRTTDGGQNWSTVSLD